jgi:hypothetical protein
VVKARIIIIEPSIRHHRFKVNLIHSNRFIWKKKETNKNKGKQPRTNLMMIHICKKNKLLDLRENARIYRKKDAACPEVQRYDLASLRKPKPRTRTTATRASDLSKREECH